MYKVFGSVASLFFVAASASGGVTTEVMGSSAGSEIVAITAFLSLVVSVVFISLLIAYGTRS